MSNPFHYDCNKELRQPLTKYQALKLAAKLMALHYVNGDEGSQFAENYIDELFSVAEQILEKDESEINQLLQSDKEFAYQEITIQKNQNVQ